MTSQRKKGRTVVDDIVESLCQDIFRGEHEVGENLPPLRTMAQTYDVTLPTMQRVVARMEELGMVEARQGSGVKVLEPLQHAAPAAMTFWLHVLCDEPAKAVEFVSSFVQVRRELAVNFMRELKQRGLDAEERVLMEEKVRAFEERTRTPMSHEEALEMDFGVMRAWLSVSDTGKVAVSMILNMFEQLVASSPEILEAVYEHPERNALGYRAVYDALVDEDLSEQKFFEEVSALLRTFDMISMARFEALVEVQRGRRAQQV